MQLFKTNTTSVQIAERLARFDAATTALEARREELRTQHAEALATDADPKEAEEIRRALGDTLAALEGRDLARTRLRAEYAAAVEREQEAAREKELAAGRAWAKMQGEKGRRVAAAIRALAAVLKDFTTTLPSVPRAFWVDGGDMARLRVDELARATIVLYRLADGLKRSTDLRGVSRYWLEPAAWERAATTAEAIERDLLAVLTPPQPAPAAGAVVQAAASG